jgi:2-C-methyl-D-erythritol 4-phosphate cytidylyltransferase
MNVAIILSGGSSNRFGGDLPKQYHKICGKQVLAYSVEMLKSAKSVDRIIITAAGDYIDELKRVYNTDVITGGKTRNESLRKTLDYISENIKTCKKLFINEAARPFVTSELVNKYFDLLDGYDSVITAQCITDSLGQNGIHITDRSEYYLVQAPEAFKFDLLERHFNANSDITATNQQMPRGSSLYKNYEFHNNLKITYSYDLLIAEHLMRKIQ